MTPNVQSFLILVNHVLRQKALYRIPIVWSLRQSPKLSMKPPDPGAKPFVSKGRNRTRRNCQECTDESIQPQRLRRQDQTDSHARDPQARNRCHHQSQREASLHCCRSVLACTVGTGMAPTFSARLPTWIRDTLTVANVTEKSTEGIASPSMLSDLADLSL